jgi:hypothetical protein
LNKSLLKSFEALEKQKEQLLQAVSAVPAEDFHYSPGAGKWSISEVLAHLLASEQLSVAYMQKKIGAIKALKNSGFSASLRMGLLIVSQRVPLKYKAPKVIVSNTPQELALQEITNRWATVRQDLKKILESLEEADQKKLIFKHPLAGKFNAAQAIVFLKEHIHHHLPQIKRLIRK